MTLRRGTLVAALAVACAAGAGSAFRGTPSPVGPEGCWDVKSGLWRAAPSDGLPRRPSPDRAVDSTAFVLPPRIHLTARPLRVPGVEGWMSASAPEGALPTGHRHQAWRHASEGGLLLWFAASRAGLRVVLEPSGDTYRGLARTFDVDDDAWRWERDVMLAPADCGSEPPVSADVLPPLPREVRLSGGAVLSLGGSPPEGLRTFPRPSGAVGVAGLSAGLFAGSDSVAYRVGDNDGRIGVMQLIFPPPADADSIIARVTDRFGPPDPNTPVPGAWWHNRVTELSVITEPEGGFRVLLQDPRSW